jgi:hypothetical protein
LEFESIYTHASLHHFVCVEANQVHERQYRLLNKTSPKQFNKHPAFNVLHQKSKSRKNIVFHRRTKLMRILLRSPSIATCAHLGPALGDCRKRAGSGCGRTEAATAAAAPKGAARRRSSTKATTAAASKGRRGGVGGRAER